MNHLRVWGYSLVGSLATAGLDLGGAAHCVTIAAGALTLIYTGYKIALLRARLKKEKREKES